MKTIKVRKSHNCEHCGSVIHPGATATAIVLLDLSNSFEGSKYKAYFHPDCYGKVFRKKK